MKQLALVIIIIAGSLNCNGSLFGSYKDTINYEKLVDDIMSQVIVELIKKYPRESVLENISITRDITRERFWVNFYYSSGIKWVPNPDYNKNKKSSKEIKEFEQNGIEISLFFYRGNWTGQQVVNPIKLKDINIVIIVNNDKKGLYSKVEKILNKKRNSIN